MVTSTTHIWILCVAPRVNLGWNVDAEVALAREAIAPVLWISCFVIQAVLHALSHHGLRVCQRRFCIGIVYGEPGISHFWSLVYKCQLIVFCSYVQAVAILVELAGREFHV